MVYSRLKKIRMEKGITQEELSRSSKVGRTTISDIENGNEDKASECLISACCEMAAQAIRYFGTNDWNRPFVCAALRTAADTLCSTGGAETRSVADGICKMIKNSGQIMVFHTWEAQEE